MAHSTGTELLNTAQFDRPARALLVTSDHKFAVTISDYLEQRLHIPVVSGVLGALAAAKHEESNIAIIDAVAIGSQALSLCRELRSEPELENVPIILIGNLSAEDQIAALESGVNEFVTLPVSASLLEARVRALLKYRRVVSALREARASLEMKVKGRTAELQKEIAERRQAEQALRRVTEKVRCVLWSARVRKLANGFDWKFDTFLFEPLREAFGIAPMAIDQEVISWYRLIPEDQARAMDQTAQTAMLASREAYHQEFSIRGPDGKMYSMQEDVEITQTTQNEWYLIGVQVDITKRKQAETRLTGLILQARCIFWEALVSKNAAGIYSWNMHFNTSETTLQRELWLALEGETLSEGWKRLLKTVPPEQLSRIQKTSSRALENGDSGYQQEFLVRTPFGAARWLSETVSISPVEKNKWNLVGLVTDTTARKSAEEEVRESGERFKALIEHMDPLYLHDFAGRVITVNQPACEQLGYTRIELLDLNVEEIIVDFEPQKYLKIWRNIRGTHGLVSRFRRKDGTAIPVELRYGSIELGARRLVLCIAHDITERLKQEETLRASEERYALASRGANDGLWDWNLTTSELYLSPRWIAMIDAQDAKIGTAPDEWFSRVHADDLVRLKQDLDAHLTGKTPHFHSEYRLLHRDGTYRWMLCRGIAVRHGENPYRMVGSQTDITEKKNFELKLMHDALHDDLTGLPNRALLRERLQHLINKTQRNAEFKFAVLFMDIDRFKMVNDSLGHGVGDQLLVQISERLQRSIRATDMLARLGGDEFVIALEDVANEIEATRFANRAREDIRAPFILEGRSISVSASIGIALSNAQYRHPDEVLRDADTALYQAKPQGPGKQEVFSSGMHTSVVSLLDLENDMRLGVERKEFVLYYQPIVALASGHIVGFEALIRWNHPKRGLLNPLSFIGLAEDTDMILPMTLWVLQEGCSQLKRLQSNSPGPLYLTINLSSKSLTDAKLVEQVQAVLLETRVPGSAIKFEITESTIMKNAERSMVILSRLKEMDIDLCIDDFGTGYSSLSYLQRLPLQILKIDRSFVSDVNDGNKDAVIVKAIKSLANNLGMRVVAEGVETGVQAKYLSELDCEFAQGYFFSRPVPVDQAANLLRDNPDGFPRKW